MDLVQFFTTVALSGEAPQEGGGLFGNMSFILIMVLMLGAMYFIMIRPNKKKEKAAQEMRNSLDIGDEVTTIGGIVGRVVSIKEDTIVLETAGERSRIRFLRGAIDKVNKLSLEDEKKDAKPADKAKPEKAAKSKGEK